MHLLDTLLSNTSRGGLGQAGRALGMDEAGMAAALRKLVPALTGGVQRNLTARNGLEQLQRALASGEHQRYVEDPAALDAAETRADGNAILGHLLGGKDASRALAAETAAETGLDVGTLKRFLPLVAAATMGALSKETAGGYALGEAAGGAGLLGRLLDANDGNLGKLVSFGRKLF